MNNEQENNQQLKITGIYSSKPSTSNKLDKIYYSSIAPSNQQTNLQNLICEICANNYESCKDRDCSERGSNPLCEHPVPHEWYQMENMLNNNCYPPPLIPIPDAYTTTAINRNQPHATDLCDYENSVYRPEDLSIPSTIHSTVYTGSGCTQSPQTTKDRESTLCSINKKKNSYLHPI